MSEKCRIVILTDTYVGTPGGSERHLHNFLSSISTDFEVDAVQMSPSGNPMLADGALSNKEHVCLYSRPVSNVRSIATLKLIFELWLLIRKKNVDIVVSYHEKSDIINFILKYLPGTKIKTVTSKRDMGFKLTANLKKIMQFVTPRLENITAPSKSIAKQMVKEYSTDVNTTHVINNGVDLSIYGVASSEKKASLRLQLNLPVASKIISVVGSLKPIKGHKYLIEAFSNCKIPEAKGWKLILLGSGELEDELKRQAQDAGIADRVMFAGFQGNIQDWLGASDLVVSSSLSEGLSNALVEATASGLPVVATDVGGNPEVVENMFNGLLVKAGSAECLASAIIKIMTNKGLYSEMCLNARRKAEDNFSNLVMVHKLEELYRSLKHGH